MLNILLSYPAFIAAIATTLTFIFTIFFATKNSDKESTLCDISIDSKTNTSMTLLIIGMLTEATAILITMAQANMVILEYLTISFYIALVGWMFHIITPFCLAIGKYKTHIITFGIFIALNMIAQQILAIQLYAMLNSPFVKYLSFVPLISIAIILLSYKILGRYWIFELILTIVMLIYFIPVNLLFLSQ